MNLESEFDSLSLRTVREMVALQQEENLSLEFKTVSSADFTLADDRRNLAIALSGFANSAGGIILWGVSARRDSRGVDCAQSINAIPNVPHFLSRINDLTGEATSPRLSSVRHRRIGKGAEAIVGTLIPESAEGPHMALLREQRYYKRSGSGFYVMEHFDVADMFGRRASPVLSLLGLIVGSGSSGDGDGGQEFMGRVNLSVQNSGRSSARSPYLEFALPNGQRVDRHGVTGNGHEGLPRVFGHNRQYPHRYGGSGDHVIHPGTRLDVAAIDLTVRVDKSGVARVPHDLLVDYRVASENCPIVEARLVVPGTDLVKSLAPRANIVASAG